METEKTNARWANGLSVLAGVWLIITPFLMSVGHNVGVDDIWVGAIVGVLALIRFYVANRSSAWLSWINMVLGAWLVVSPLVLSYSFVGQVWNDVILGIIVIALSAWSVNSTNKLEEGVKREPAHEHVVR